METLWAYESVLDSLNMTVVYSEWVLKDTKWIAVGKDAKEKPTVKKFRNKKKIVEPKPE